MLLRTLGVALTFGLAMLLAPLSVTVHPMSAEARSGELRLAQSRSDHLRDLDARRVPRVALIGLQSRPAAAPFIEALEAGLMAAGYSPGRSIVVEYHSAEGRSDRVADVAADVAHRNVDVIVASTNEVIQAAKRATSTIPIVMAVGGDPVGAGFVTSLARPGGNITGLTFDAVPEAYAKPLEFLKEILPGIGRVAVLRNPDPTFKRMTEAALEAGRQLGIAVSILEVGDPREFDAALARIKREGIRAVLVWPNGIVYGARQQLIGLAMRDRLLLASITRQFADDGALLTYGPSLFEIFRRTGFYVDRILKGARPASLPVEQPTTFELVINLKTARALGLTIPPSLLLRADQVIER